MSNRESLSIDDRLALEARCDSYFDELKAGPVDIVDFVSRTGGVCWADELFLALAMEKLELRVGGSGDFSECISGAFRQSASELGCEHVLPVLYAREFLIRSRVNEELSVSDFVDQSAGQVTSGHVLAILSEDVPVRVHCMRHGRSEGSATLINRLTFGRRHGSEPAPIALIGDAEDGRVVVSEEMYVSRTQLSMERISMKEVVLRNLGSKLEVQLSDGRVLKPRESTKINCDSTIEILDVSLHVLEEKSFRGIVPPEDDSIM